MSNHSDVVSGLLSIGMGIWFTLSWKKHATYTAKLNEQVFGIRSRGKLYEWGFLAGGLVFIIGGLAIMLRAILRH